MGLYMTDQTPSSKAVELAEEYDEIHSVFKRELHGNIVANFLAGYQAASEKQDEWVEVLLLVAENHYCLRLEHGVDCVDCKVIEQYRIKHEVKDE